MFVNFIHTMSNEKKFETEAVRTQVERTQFLEHSVPLYLTSSFVFEDAEDMRASFAEEKVRNIYSRFSNPTVQEFTDRMCALEGAEAGFATASGMSAVFGSFMAFLKTGDHLLSSASVFGSTHTVITKFLPKWGIEHTYFDLTKPESVEALIRPNTKMIFVETPSNPGLDLVDLEALVKIANSSKAPLKIFPLLSDVSPSILWSASKTGLWRSSGGLTSCALDAKEPASPELEGSAIASGAGGDC